MILVEVPTGLLVWRKHDIATIMPEVLGRYRVVRKCGMVAHIPTPPPPGPWVPLAPGWGNRAWLHWSEQGWQDPAEFRFPPQELEESAPPPSLPDLEGVPCRRDQIFAMTCGDNQLTWHTDLGDFVTTHLTPEAARALMPELAQIRIPEHLNRYRIHSLVLKSNKVLVTLDNGRVSVCAVQQLRLAHALGIGTYRHLQPYRHGFGSPYFVREWPMDLLSTKGDRLRQLFRSSKMLSGHLIWQRFLAISRGVEREWTQSYQELWYEFKACLNRAGFLRPQSKRALTHEEKLKLEIFEAMSYFIKDSHFFNFRQFGFREQHPERRRLGTSRAHILLLTEKKESEAFARQLADEFGVSLFMLSGQPPMAATEFFAEALLAAGITHLVLIALVDYDPSGWIIARATANQLTKLGVQVQRVDFLLRGHTFSEEEKRLHAHPCPGGLKTQNRKWLAETNGIDGQLLGIHANHVQPYTRVRSLFLDYLEEFHHPGM